MLVAEDRQQRDRVACLLEHALQLADDGLLPHAEPLELRRLGEPQDLGRVSVAAAPLSER